MNNIKYLIKTTEAGKGGRQKQEGRTRATNRNSDKHGGVNPAISITTSNVNGLNATIKR